MPHMTSQAVSLPPLSEANDIDLVSWAGRGNAGAFRIIMERNNRRLFRTIRSVLRDDAEAEDALQETYLSAFRHLGDYTGAASLSTWLTRIALNEAFGRLRRRRSMVDLNSIIETNETVQPGSGSRVVPFPLTQSAALDPEHVAARGEIRRLLEGAIDDLPDAFRMAFVLRFVEQMSVEETATCLGIPEETVKTRVHRAKRRLRQALGKQLAPALTDMFPFAGARCARITESVLHQLGIDGPSPPA
jgi:RNA polymerase sigma-70 factor, ECF subfamily